MPRYLCAVSYTDDCCNDSHALLRVVEAATPEDAERLIHEANDRENADADSFNYEIVDITVYLDAPTLGSVLVGSVLDDQT